MAAQLGLEVLPLNEEGRRSVARLTFFFLFHCPPQLYNHLVHSNWAHLPLAPRQAEDISHGDDESGGGESLVEGLSRLQLRPPDHSDDCPSLVEAALPSPLSHVVVVGNSFTSILNQRSSASSNHRSEAPSKSARRSQLSSAAATLASLSTPLCPLHSTAPPPSDTPLPSTSPRASPDAPPSPSPPPPPIRLMPNAWDVRGPLRGGCAASSSRRRPVSCGERKRGRPRYRSARQLRAVVRLA